MCKSYVRKFAPSNCTNLHRHIKAASQKKMQATNNSKTKWKKQADKCAEYFLILFRPETEIYEKNQTHPYKYD